MLKPFVACLWAAAALVGMSPARGEEQGCGKPALRVYAGAGMRSAVDKLAAAFQKESGVGIDADYAGSGMLITRAREDKEADLFMPGDVWYVDQLQEKSGLVEEKTTIAYFIPVIIVHKGNPRKITGLADLVRNDVAVGLGKAEACQVGRVSDQLLAKNGLAREHFKNVKESLTVNELAVWVEMKDIDAAIVWDAIAQVSSKGVDIVGIPSDANVISEVVVGLLKTSRHKRDAKRFIAFMRGEKGQTILTSTGYTVALPKSDAEGQRLFSAGRDMRKRLFSR